MSSWWQGFLWGVLILAGPFALYVIVSGVSAVLDEKRGTCHACGKRFWKSVLHLHEEQDEDDEDAYFIGYLCEDCYTAYEFREAVADA